MVCVCMCVCARPTVPSNLSASVSLFVTLPLSRSKSMYPTISLFFVFRLQLLYTGKVSEDISPGHFILQVSATDLDSDTNAQITYTLHGPGADEFKLDPHTGGFSELQDGAMYLRNTKCPVLCSALWGKGTGINVSIHLPIHLLSIYNVPSTALDVGT